MGGYIGATAVGLTTTAADVQGDITSTDTTPELILKNTSEEDTEGGREGKITFKGEQSGGEESTLAQIQASHDGTSDDEKGDLIFKTNDGSDGASPTEAMRIDSSQNVGIGTSSINGRLNVKSSASGTYLVNLDYADGTDGGGFYESGSDGLSLFIKDSSGNTDVSIASDGDSYFKGGKVGIGGSPTSTLHIAQSSDNSSGGLQIRNTANSNSIYIYQNGNLTTYDAGSSGAQAFKTGSTERMRIDSSGHILFKVTALPATGVGGAAFENEANHGRSILQLGQTENTSTSRTLVEFYAGSSRNGTIQVNNSSTSYNTSSDHRLKENVEDMTGAITRVKLLSPKRFSWIVDEENNANVDGFLAHEAQAVVPEAVTGTHDGMRDEEYEVTPAVLDDDGNVVTEAVMGTRSVPDYQGIDQSKLVPLLTAALQEAIAKIETLETKVAALEGA